MPNTDLTSPHTDVTQTLSSIKPLYKPSWFSRGEWWSNMNSLLQFEQKGLYNIPNNGSLTPVFYPPSGLWRYNDQAFNWKKHKLSIITLNATAWVNKPDTARVNKPDTAWVNKPAFTFTNLMTQQKKSSFFLKL